MDTSTDEHFKAKTDETLNNENEKRERKCRRTGALYQILRFLKKDNKLSNLSTLLSVGYTFLLLMCALANLCVLGPSMGFGYSAVALPILRSNSTEGLHVNEDQASWIASALAIGTPFGCLTSSFILRRGRKLSLLVTSSVSLLGWIVIYFSNIYEQILIGRIICGVAAGLASVPATVYSAEVTSPKLRSTTLTWSSMGIASGVLIVYIFGYYFPKDWKTVALICASFPAVAIVLISTIVPESPMWLRDHGRFEEATKILKKFNGLSEDDLLTPELELQLKPKVTKRMQEKNLLKKLLSRTSLKPFAIMLSFFFFQQFSGIFAIVYYAVDVTKDAGLTIDGYLGAILIGATRACGTFLVASISKKFGRRIPSIASGAGMTTFMAILAVYLFLKDQNYMVKDGGLIPALCVIMYIFMSTIGFLTLPFAMIGELFPSSVKDILSGVTTCIGYIFSFIIVKVYPKMIITISKQGVFFFYAVMSLIGTLFVIFFLPETKGKSLAEIEELFASKKKDESNILSNGNAEYDKNIMVPLRDVTSAT